MRGCNAKFCVRLCKGDKESLHPLFQHNFAALSNHSRGVPLSRLQWHRFPASSAMPRGRVRILMSKNDLKDRPAKEKKKEDQNSRERCIARCLCLLFRFLNLIAHGPSRFTCTHNAQFCLTLQERKQRSTAHPSLILNINRCRMSKQRTYDRHARRACAQPPDDQARRKAPRRLARVAYPHVPLAVVEHEQEHVLQ